MFSRLRDIYRRTAVAGTGIAVLALLFAPTAWARVSAGGAIVNTATATYDLSGAPASVTSNTTSDRVDETLDLTLTSTIGGTVTLPAAGLDRFDVPLVLTNTGNGKEAFILGATAPGQAAAPTVAIDVDGNGTYDTAVDITLSPDTATPLLAPGASLPLLLHYDDAPTQASTVNVAAHAATGHGAAGTVFAGKGDDGVDAMVGATRAEAALPIAFAPEASGTPLARLEKSQQVLAPDGSRGPVRGAVITYRLTLTTTSAVPLSDGEIIDPIPAGTRFVPGSIRIEDVAASDVSDADAAMFDGQAIRIALGEISQPTTRIVTFQVTIL